MFIGIDASRANKDQKTGVEWYAWHLIENLKKITPDNVRVVLYSREELKNELAELPEKWESKVLRWPPKRLWTQFRLSLEMIFNRPDVLFIPSHIFPIIHPKKTVMTTHDVAALKFPESYSWFQKWYTIWSAKFAVKKLWKVIVPSQSVFEEITKSRLNTGSRTLSGLGNNEIKGNIYVVHHGYDKRYKKIYNQEKIQEVLRKYNIREPFVLSVGRLEEKKNTKRIIKAFNYLNDNMSHVDYQLVLIGNPGYGYADVKQEIIQSSYKYNIILLDLVSPDDLAYIMNAARVFVFPSLCEGFGLPVLEAMACGVPVVAARGSSLEEVGGEAGIYVNPDSFEDIAKGVMKVLQAGGLKQEKVIQGLRRVENFSWEKCARETLEVLLMG